MMKRIMILMMIASPLVLGACNDDDDCPTCPGGTPLPTLANIWPHADGTAWTFDGVYRESTIPAPAKDVLKAVPTMEELHAALAEPLPGDVTAEVGGLYRFALDGMITTRSGATGQRVVETLFGTPDSLAAPAGEGLDPLLLLVARARPDLRPALAARYGMGTKDFVQIPNAPYLLGGYCFSAEEDGYFGYGDLGQQHNWVYLEGDLSVGSEFSLQFVHLLPAEVWMYGRIWSLGEKTVNGHPYENVLECMYLIDLGEVELTDATGAVIGRYHPYIYGQSFFVPDLGPVAGVERHVFGPEDPQTDPGDTELFEYVLDLVGTTRAD